MGSTISQEVCTVHPDFLIFYNIQRHYGLQRGIQMDSVDSCSTNLLECLPCARTQARRRCCPAFKGLRAQGSGLDTDYNRPLIPTRVVTAGCYSVTGTLSSLYQAKPGRGFKTAVECFLNEVHLFKSCILL